MGQPPERVSCLAGEDVDGSGAEDLGRRVGVSDAKEAPGTEVSGVGI